MKPILILLVALAAFMLPAFLSGCGEVIDDDEPDVFDAGGAEDYEASAEEQIF